jgi:hypothetical protein
MLESKALKIGKEGRSFENKSWKGKLEHKGIQLVEKFEKGGVFENKSGVEGMGTILC